MKIKKLSFLFSVAIAVVLLISATLLTASAEEITYPIEGGCLYYDNETGMITGIGGNVKNLDIPAEINGTTIVGIKKSIFYDSDDYYGGLYRSFDRVTIPGTIKRIENYTFDRIFIKELILCDGIEEIGKSAFACPWYLTKLTIPGSVKIIEDDAFADCTSLKELTIEEGVEYIGKYAFDAADITELVLPSTLKSVGECAFALCSYLESVTYYSNTFIDKYAFDECPKNMKFTVLEAVRPASPAVSVDGLKLTVHNLDGVKDYFIGKGEHSTYRDTKNNSVMRVTAERINGATSYTYNLKETGEYTVCVRFEDGSEDLFLHCTVSVPLPKFAVKGLNVTVSNLQDIRVIRTAAGEWNSPGEVKRAPGCRNITANTIGGKNSYTINYKEDGVYTVTLEYYNGLVVVEHIELTRTVPTFTREGNKVIIGNLDDLYTIRFAKGEYSTMGEIKRAEGCQIRRSRDIQNGVITVKYLDPGTYTFCVQYNDNSYHYYTAVVE